MRRSLFLWIFPPYLIAVVLSAAAFTLFAANASTDFFYDLSSIKMRETARLARNALSPHLDEAILAGKISPLVTAARELTSNTSVRVTVIDSSGQVIVDTVAKPDAMDIHLDREEVREAFGSGWGSAMRRSASTGITTTYEALSVRLSDGTDAIVRVAMPLSAIDERRTALVFEVAFFGLCVTILVSILAIYLTRRISAPIRRIDAAARAFSSGSFDTRIKEEGPREVASLATVLNRMALQLDERIRTTNEQASRLAGILNGMTEAVAVVDSRLSVISSNVAFSKIFGGKAAGDLLAVTRSTEIHDFMRTALATPGPLESTITLYGDKPLRLRVASSPIEGGKAILVITDLTKLYRLETVRRDFTTNVSHELKTPITSLKAALETIRDGGCKDPEQCSRFIEIASRGADRLESILRDLLSLARIEEDENGTGIDKETVSLDAIVDAALAEIAAKAGPAGVTLTRTGERGLTINAHEGLVRQAIVNLLDNAVKYAAEGKIAELNVSVDQGFAAITVRDQGPGIPERDRPRLFERFYRVDKARSRETGGTGLGLSIVKHIAVAHGGSVSLESAEGKGSTFGFTLPI